MILLVAAVLRIRGLSFGLPAMNDPDELMFETGAIKLLVARTINPGWFGHPATTTIYVLAVLDVLVFAGGWLGGLWASPKAFATATYGNPSWVILPARFAMVLFAIISIWLTYRLGRALFDRRAGLFAALLVAVSPLHVTYSQVIRSDIMAICFMLLCLLATLRVAKGGGRRDLLSSSIWLALAIITKWPFALAGLGMVGISVRRVRLGVDTFGQAIRRIALFGAASALLVLCFSPYLLLDYPVVVQNLHGEAQIHHLGATGGSPWHNLLWYIRGPFVLSFGWAGCAFVACGAILLRKWREGWALLVPVMLGFIFIIAAQTLIWERWMLPLAPLFALLAGLAYSRLLDVPAMPQSRVKTVLAAVAAAAIAIPSIAATSGRTTERMHDTRQLASAWARDHIPAGSNLLVEHFGFDMLAYPWNFMFPMGDAGCVDARKMLAGKIAYSTVSAARGQRSNVDYGTLNPAKRETCRADYAMLTQYDRYAAERAAFPAEYEAYRKLLQSGRIIATFRPEPGKTGGPIVRIVRFAH